MTSFLSVPKFDYDPKRGVALLNAQYSMQTPIYGHRYTHKYFRLTRDGRLVVYPGYQWDLATGAVDNVPMVAASLPHDIFCQMTNENWITWEVRKPSDKYFRLRLKQYGAWPLRRWYAWGIVRANSLWQAYKKRKGL